MIEHDWKRHPGGALILIGLGVVACANVARLDSAAPPEDSSECSGPLSGGQSVHPAGEAGPDQVLQWNQIFIDTLVATNTANSSSQRLGAIVHTAIFDAYNGIAGCHAPLLVEDRAPAKASRPAAVIAAAHTALVGLFPARQAELNARYEASLAALPDGGEDDGQPRKDGIAWGTRVGQAVLAWRMTDGWSGEYPSFVGGTAIGQWRPTPPASGPMSAKELAFTRPFVLESETRFRPGPPRPLTSASYTEDLRAVRTLGGKTGSTRTEEQTALAVFWDGNASVHWNQAANQMAHANKLSTLENTRLLAAMNIAMADTAITIWSSKRFYGSVAAEVTWRPVTSIALAGADDNPETAATADWLPLINTPSHPEYPAGHPSLNGAAATVLLGYFQQRSQSFVLTTPEQPDRRYTSIAQARDDGNNGRVWGGMHYPSTVRISDAVGAAIAKHINENALGRRP